MKTIGYILLMSFSLFISCNTETTESKEEVKEEKKIMEQENAVERPLETALNEKKAKFEEKASDPIKKIYGEGIQSVVDNKVVENALQVGDTAPDFTLTNAAAEKVSLYQELEKGPVVLLWYRGGWCPYCNLTLHEMQNLLPVFQEQGANLLALTPELPDNSMSTKEKNNLQFQVLSDVDNVVANEYKVVFKLTDDVAESYEKSFGLSQYNGNEKGELPLAATYIIGQDKRIKYAFLDADYRNRAEPQDVLEALKKM